VLSRHVGVLTAGYLIRAVSDLQAGPVPHVPDSSIGRKRREIELTQ